MRYPIRVLSDLHLGHPASKVSAVEELRPLIQGAGTVIFNGDTWQEMALDLQEHSHEMLQELKALCVECDAEYLFLPGNHDPGFTDHLYLKLHDGKVAIFHGDVIFPEVSPWSKYYLSQQFKIDTLIKKEMTPDMTLESRYSLAHAVVDAMKPVRRPLKGQTKWHYYLSILFPPQRAWLLLNIKRIAMSQTRRFCQQYFSKAEVIIFGHFHTPFSAHMGGKHIINTGAFMEGCQMQAVEISEQGVQVLPIVKGSKGLYVYSHKEP